MAVLNYISATSTPISPDSSTTPPIPGPRQTKIILPNKKPEKWSTGVSPGDYGGPPVSSKPRKYWIGVKEDPLTSDEYIWNRDFMDGMKRLIQDQPDDSSVQANNAKDEPSGFLSLNRVMTLDSMEVDLSKELIAPPTSGPAKVAEEDIKIVSRKSPRWKLAPTRREQEKWERASKAATGGSDVMFRELRRPRGDPEVLAALSREQYFKLKKKLQILTMAIGGVGLVSAYVSYSPEVAASFGAGLIGSLMYIRMLGSSVDSMADGAKGLVKGAIAQPRLLVPVILVMVYSRWNEILVEDYGVMQLQLIPMLVGFFTYKVATFVQALEDALRVVEKEPQA